MINLEWLRTFKTVYEKGSMTATAEELYISQPGVSLHLGSLESYVGYKLFQRLPRKLIPTERGKLLYNAIVDPINQLQKTEKNIQKSTREDTPSLTVGMCFETFRTTLEKHVPQLPFNLIMEFGCYRNLLQKIASGIIDLVVTPRKKEIKNVTYQPVSQEKIILLAGRGTDIESFKKVEKRKHPEHIIEWLKGQKWYGITGDNEHLRRFWQLNFNTYPDFRPNFIVPSIHSIITSLCNAPGLAVLPDFLCLKEIESGALTILWKGFTPLVNTLYLAKRKVSIFPSQIEHLEAIIKKELP